MLTIKNISKQYNDSTIISSLNLEINSGEIYCLLGHNGVGKSTTLNLILGFIKPDQGEILIDGLPIIEGKVARTFLSYVPDEVALYENLSGFQNLKLFTDLTGRKLSNDDYFNYLAMVGLPKDSYNLKITSYSKGMRQKIAIAIALAKKSKFIVMDEPTNGLDPVSVQNLIQLCKEISTQGISIILTTHDLFFAHKISDRIGLLRDGAISKEFKTKFEQLETLQNLFIQNI